MNGISVLPRDLLRSPSRLCAAFFGLLLVISVFIPWLSPNAKLASHYSSLSGVSISSLLLLSGLFGGLLVIGFSLWPKLRVRGTVHILLAVAVLTVLSVLIFNRTLPLLSSAVRSLVSVSAGIYLYILSGLAIAITGIIELPRRQRRASMPVEQVFQTGIPASPVEPVAPSFCANCGSQFNPPGASFCSGCGTPVALAAPAVPVYGQPAYQPPPMKPVQKVSGAWWLLPIFLGALGGIIAFFAVLKRRPLMAVAMLILGIILTAVAFFVIRTIVTNALSNYGISLS